jgi:hypothetical protein
MSWWGSRSKVIGLAFPTGFFAGGGGLLCGAVFTDLEAVDEQGGRMWRQNSGVQAEMPIHAYITLLYDFYMYAYKSNHQIVQRHIHLCKLRILCQEVFRHIRPCFFKRPNSESLKLQILRLHDWSNTSMSSYELSNPALKVLATASAWIASNSS